MYANTELFLAEPVAVVMSACGRMALQLHADAHGGGNGCRSAALLDGVVMLPCVTCSDCPAVGVLHAHAVFRRCSATDVCCTAAACRLCVNRNCQDPEQHSHAGGTAQGMHLKAGLRLVVVTVSAG